MKIQSYLIFDGRREEALEFYRQARGAEVRFPMRYKDSPDAPPPGTVAERFGVPWMVSVAPQE